MFLSEKEIDEVLACPNCNEKLEEGKFLPCGESVCAKCIDKIIEDNEKRREGEESHREIKCQFCNEQHLIPLKGFPSNKIISKLISKKPSDVFRGETTEKFKQDHTKRSRHQR